MTDLVISAASNFDWAPLQSFAVSLSRSGFKGDKVMFVQNLTQAARNGLMENGITLVDYPVAPGNFFVNRYYPAIEFLKHSQFRYVIWVDCRDLVFQSDPAAWLEQHLYPHSILGCSMGLAIKDDGVESTWVNTLVGPKIHEWLKEEEALCSGTIAGDAETVLNVFSRVYEMGVEASALYPDFKVGMDEGLLNYVLRVSPFKEKLYIPRMAEGFTASCTSYLRECFSNSPWRDSKPRIEASGLVFPEGSPVPFSIAHQYDRNPDWYSLVHKRYSQPDPVLPTPRSLRWKKRLK